MPNPLVKLICIANIKKSSLESTKNTFLRSVFDLEEGLVFPILERIHASEQALFDLNLNIFTFVHRLGILP